MVTSHRMIVADCGGPVAEPASTNTSIPVLLAALLLTACGKKSPPDCSTIGRKLGAAEIEERYGHLAEFMSERERGEVVARWTRQCEASNPTAAVRRCMAAARTTAEARGCQGGERGSGASANDPPRGAPETRWVQVVGGPGIQEIAAVEVAPDRDVVAAGHFGAPLLSGGSPTRARLGDTTVTSAGAEDIWVARFAPDGAPRWLTRLGGSRSDYVGALAVTAKGTVVVSPVSHGDVDYGAGMDYLRDTLEVGITAPVVIVTLATDGTTASARALPLGGVADSIGAFPDGDIVVATRASEVPRGQAKCQAPAFALARVRDDGSIAWTRCNDATSTARFTGSEGTARVAVGPDGAVAMCASFTGEMSWAGQVGGSEGEESTVFVVSLDSKGVVRWVRFAYGDVHCADLAIASDGAVAARLDGFPEPDQVRIDGAEVARGAAIAAWSSGGNPLWLRTCSDLLGIQECAVRSLAISSDHLALAVRNGKEALLADLVPGTAEALNVRAAPPALLGPGFVKYDGSFAFGATSDAEWDPGVGTAPPKNGDRDAVIGVFAPAARGMSP